MIPLPCEPADIAENRQGRLSSAQRTLLEQKLERERRYGGIPLTMFVTFFVATGTFTHHEWSLARRITGAAIAETVFLVLLIWFLRRAGRRAVENLRIDTVACVTGRLERRQRSRWGRMYYVEFGGQKTLGAPLELIDPHRNELEQHVHRVYYLDRAEQVVSFEPM